MKYQSGEEIRKGDRVLFHGDPGEVEFVADPIITNSETDWYVKEQGGGVMVREPKSFGLVFISDTQNVEDLVLLSRAADALGAKS